jgi:hypothetical protein
MDCALIQALQEGVVFMAFQQVSVLHCPQFEKFREAKPLLSLAESPRLASEGMGIKTILPNESLESHQDRGHFR